LRAIAKELARTNPIEYMELEDITLYEEKVIQGLIIGMAKLSVNETQKYLEKFIPKIDSWAVCDVVCSSLKIANKNQKEMWDFLEKYIKSNEEFEIRFAVVMYLDYYLNEEYIDRVIKNISKIKSNKYYVQMAIAWLVSVSYIKQKEKTLEYLKNNKLYDFTHNKAIQKIIESYRVSKEEKEFVRTLKRKAI
jgi:3-methyladenine DNA glycosylase AlkD